MGKLTNFIKKPGVRKTGKWTLITFKWLFITGLTVCFFGGALGFGLVSALVKDDPVRTKEFMQHEMQQNAITGFVYFNKDDQLIGQLRTEEDRRLAELKEIPQVVLDAVLAIEDNDFYKHYGIDISGLLRAVKQKVLNEPVQTGGSTITQQLARIVFLTLDKEVDRKAKEILLSLRMERMMSKDEILLAYLNKIPYGNGSTGYNLYGIKAAAKGVFGIEDLSQINIAQAAYLAGLPQQPSNFSAFSGNGKFNSKGFKAAVERQKLVLKRMLEEGKITEAEHQEALNFDLYGSLAKPGKKAYNTYPFLMIEAERQATEILTKLQYPDLDPVKDKEQYANVYKKMHQQLLHGGYQVYTTIDKTIYDSMRSIAENEKNFSPEHRVKGIEQVGAVMLDSKTSAILGMIEGRSFGEEQLNLATQAYRQPGSVMKPVAAYIPAMEQGIIQPASIIDDVPMIMKDGQKGYHIPQNHDKKFHGLITARKALDQSYNIPALKIFNDMLGIEQAWDFARKMGVQSLSNIDLQAQTGVIGGLSKGVTVKEMTNAYATMSNQGQFNQAYMIRSIKDSEGNIVYEHKLNPTTVFSEQTAYLITDMMRTVISQGTGGHVNKVFKHKDKVSFVGKTGSTQDDSDAWFMGYTPDITVGVWVGFDKPIHTLSNKNGETRHAMEIWSKVMNEAIELKPELFPNKKFVKPDNIVSATVSSVSGKLPNELTKEAKMLVTDIFNRKHLPTEEDNMMTKAKVISYKGLNYIANPLTPEDFATEKVVILRQEPINEIMKQLEEILPKISAKSRRPLESYKPLDYDSAAPQEPDPRVDDGSSPVPPSTVVVTSSGENAVLTFQGSPSEDVVGYRIYRAKNIGSFQLLQGQVVLADAETKFTDTITPGNSYSYFVTAVDVVGNESAPSNAVNTDGMSIDPGMLPDPSTLPGEGDSDDNVDNDGNTGEVIDEEPVVNVPSAPTGLKFEPNGVALMFKWTPNQAEDKVQKYHLYFSETEDGDFEKIGTVQGAKSQEYLYIGLTFAGYYKMTAENEAGESAPTATIQYK